MDRMRKLYVWCARKKLRGKAGSKISIQGNWEDDNLFGRVYKRNGRNLCLHGKHAAVTRTICLFRLAGLWEITEEAEFPSSHLLALPMMKRQETGVTKLKMPTGVV